MDDSNIPPTTIKSLPKTLAMGDHVMEPVVEKQEDLEDSGNIASPLAPKSRSRESSIERADRRRMELKTKLEIKNKAPVKKKRRF